MSNNDHNRSRRAFFKKGALAFGALFLSSSFGKNALSSLAFAADAQKPLSENDPMAKTLGYQVNAAKVDPKKWPKKAGPDAKEQKCSTCMFYTSIDGKHGKCQIFANNTVLSNAWCNSWAKKA